MPVHLGENGKHVDAAMIALGRLSSIPERGIERFLLSRLMRRQEAVSSSGMEGTQSTLDAILSIDAGTEQDATARQVRSYALTLEELVPQAVQLGPDVFTPALFKEIHERAMRDDPDLKGDAGAYRDRVVWIGGSGNDIAYSTWNPPGPEHIPACLEQTALYMRGNGPQVISQNLIARIAIAHAHFEAVHPFLDGNGRVGRLLIPLMLAAEGHEPVYISPWIEAHRDRYYEGLKAAQQRLDYGPLVGALAEALVATEMELTKTRDALKAVTALWTRQVKFRRNSSAVKTLAILPYFPILSVQTLKELLGVTAKAAGEGIDQLVEADILEEVTGKARNRVFVALDVMRIIARPFGMEPVVRVNNYSADTGEPGWQ